MSTGAWLQLAVFMALLLALAWPLALALAVLPHWAVAQGIELQSLLLLRAVGSLNL